MAMAATPHRRAQCSSPVMACRTCASRCPVLPDRSYPNRRVGQMRQRCGQPYRYFAVGGDADGFVAVPLPALAVGLAEPASGFPSGPPLAFGESGGVQVVAVVQQAFAAAHHVRPPGVPVGLRAGEAVLEGVQAAGLVKPLVPGPVPARRPPGALGPDRQGQPVLDGGDSGFQAVQVGEVAAAGQGPLVVGGLGDRPGPPRRRLTSQLPFAVGPPVGVVRRPSLAAGLEVTTGQRPQVRTHLTQHPLVPVGQALEAGSDRHPRRAGGHERRADRPYRLPRRWPLVPSCGLSRLAGGIVCAGVGGHRMVGAHSTGDGGLRHDEYFKSHSSNMQSTSPHTVPPPPHDLSLPPPARREPSPLRAQP